MAHRTHLEGGEPRPISSITRTTSKRYPFEERQDTFPLGEYVSEADAANRARSKWGVGELIHAPAGGWYWVVDGTFHVEPTTETIQ